MALQECTKEQLCWRTPAAAIGRDCTAELAGRENKAEFHRGWHNEQHRECNFHHTEQSKITSDSELGDLLGNLRLPEGFSMRKSAISSLGSKSKAG
jgi:hypothetical protein